MASPYNQPLPPPRPWARLAVAWAPLVVLLLAAAIFVRPAAASALPAQGTAAASLEDEEIEAEEEMESEEGEEEESEGEEEDEELGTVGALLLPPDCLLHTAEAHVAASAAHGVVQLRIRYTSYAPTDVDVAYWLKGGKGSLQLGGTKRHFAQQGTFREEEHLGDRAMGKVLAARAFIVQLSIPAAPSYCERYSTQRLTARHVAAGHATWSRPN